MKRLIMIAICLAPGLALQAFDRVDTAASSDGFRPATVIDSNRLHGDAKPELTSERGLCLDAELADRAGGRWGLKWKLLGDVAELPRTAGGDGWRAVVTLTSPDGQTRERVFARGTGLPDRFTETADDWEWRSQGEALLPAKLSFDIDGRKVILLLESLDNPDAAESPLASRVRVRGFVNLGLEKTYLSGKGRLDRDWSLMAESAPHGAVRNTFPELPSTD